MIFVRKLTPADAFRRPLTPEEAEDLREIAEDLRAVHGDEIAEIYVRAMRGTAIAERERAVLVAAFSKHMGADVTDQFDAYLRDLVLTRKDPP